MSDKEAVERFLAGDREAFGELYRAYRGPVYAVAYAMLHDPAEAEECCEGAWVVALDRIRSFDVSRSFRAWVCGIGRRLAMARRRCRACCRTVPFSSLAPSEEPSVPGPEARERARFRVLRRRLRALPPRQRRDVWLRFGLGYANREIAALDGRSPVTVASNVYRGLAKLRRMYGRSGVNHEDTKSPTPDTEDDEG